MRKHSIWGEPFDVFVKGENDQGRPFTRVTSYAARAAVEGFILLLVSEVIQCTNDGTERVGHVSTNIQYVEDLPASVRPPPAEEEAAPEPEPPEEPDGFDDVREALAISRSADHDAAARLANLGHVFSRLSDDDLPDDLKSLDRVELDELAESLSKSASSGAEGHSTT